MEKLIDILKGAWKLFWPFIVFGGLIVGAAFLVRGGGGGGAPAKVIKWRP